MDQIMQDITDWVWYLPAISIYAVFFILAYIENVVPPIPGDLLIVLAGYLAAEGLIRFVPVLFLTTIASVIGFMTVYALGRYWGDAIKVKQHKFWMFRFVKMKYYIKARDWMNRWGQGVILVNRFLAGTRSVIALVAGISHTHYYYTIASSFVSSLLWNSILLGTGWIIKENWETIGQYLDIYGLSILILIVLIVLLRITWKRYKKVQILHP